MKIDFHNDSLVMGVLLVMTEVRNFFRGKEVFLGDLLRERSLDCTDSQLAILVSLFKKEYNTREMMQTIIPLFVDGDYTESYLIFVLELAAQKTIFFCTLIVELNKFAEDEAAGPLPQREMIKRAMKECENRLRALREQTSVSTSSCSIL